MYVHIHLTPIYKTRAERKRKKGDAFNNSDNTDHTQENGIHNSSKLNSLGRWIT